MRRRFLILAVSLLWGVRVQAQDGRPPESGGFTADLGQPRIWHRHAGVGAGFMFDESGPELLGEGRFGVYRDIVNPVMGLLGFQGEAYAGARGTRFDYGLRAQIVSPYLRLGFGFDLNGLDRTTYPLISLFHPVRRGGILLRGSQVRLNYLPGRDHSFSLGLEVPVDRRISMGSTRPRASAVSLEVVRAPPGRTVDDPALEAAIDTLRASGYWITRLTVPFLEQSEWNSAGDSAAIHELRQLKSRLWSDSLNTLVATPLDEVRRFHGALDHALSLAVGARVDRFGDCSDLGLLVARHAREVMLEEVLLPYDRLLGRVKDPDSLAGLGTRARGVFLRWLHTASAVPPERIPLALQVFTEYLQVLEASRRLQHERWNDSRFVWLPLQLGLLPEQHDTQAEVDALIERMTRVPFSEGNRVWYIVNEQFPLQLSRTIHAAESYHVLWVHDIRGYDAAGNPDEMTYRHVLGAYLSALIERVRAYDDTGTFPAYMIFLDQWYYEANGSRFWLELLEHPLTHRLDLPRGFQAWEDTIAAAQAELRRAVEASHLLQAQAEQFGEKWLHDLVSVHISITNPADATFWRNDIVPLWGIPDNVMRDHRKIAFYDITETDPYRGGAIYTGGGVGEHYTTPSWEDRSLVVEGPALLTLKRAARALLLNQGIEADQIPWALQPRSLPNGAERPSGRADIASSTVRALEVHNETGYNPKDLNALKAVLYTMMPPGAVTIVPDALWSSGFWSGLLVGHALRGGRTLIIAPAPANAPSTKMFALVRSQDVLSRIVLARTVLQDAIRAQGGLLELGVYNPVFQVTDLKGKLDAFRQTLVEHAWFRELYDLGPDVLAAFDSLSAELTGQNERWKRLLQLEDPGISKLHLKANFIASKEAWTGVLHLTEWPEVLRAFMLKRAWQIENRDRALGRLDAPMPDVIDVGQPMLDRWLAGLSAGERDRLILYLMVGSHNQNYRSMALDGEVAFLVAGASINAGLIDLVAITGQCTWVATLDEIATLFPDPGGFRLRLARWLKLLL